MTHRSSRIPGGHLFGVLLAVCVLSSCTVGPDFHAPHTTVPESFEYPTVDPAAKVSEVTPGATDVTQWWNAFNDPTLTSLIVRAALQSLDVQAAGQRIRQARAARGVAAADYYPQVNANASAERIRQPITSSSSHTGNLFQAGLDASWEIDIFGGVRRSVEAAEADITFAVEDRRDILVTLLSEVALNYADLRGAQEQLRVARENLDLQIRTLDITRRKFEGGLTTRLDVANAEAQVATTRSALPGFEATIATTIYDIGILLGQEPTSLESELLTPAPIPPVPPSVPAGLPSELLQRRPDIRRAEAHVHSATARIGVATSDLYPKFSLTGSFGFADTQLSSLLSAGNRSWAIGPGVSWAAFDGGRIRSNIEVNRALTDEALLTYQDTILLALRDVQAALENYAKEQERRAALAEAVDANRQAVDMSTKLYAEGLTDFINVLNAQRSLLLAEDALTLSTRALSSDLIALYKALGGGWQPFEPGEMNAAAAPPPPSATPPQSQ